MSNPHVNPFGKTRRQYITEEDKGEAVEGWVSCHGKEPNAAIGLQASHISWDDGKCSYEAGTPWWRQETSEDSKAQIDTTAAAC